MDANPMTILLGILAVLLVATFLAVWLRDRNRSRNVADDEERLEP